LANICSYNRDGGGSRDAHGRVHGTGITGVTVPGNGLTESGGNEHNLNGEKQPFMFEDFVSMVIEFPQDI
jgi:hypothetical protein